MSRHNARRYEAFGHSDFNCDAIFHKNRMWLKMRNKALHT